MSSRCVDFAIGLLAPLGEEIACENVLLAAVEEEDGAEEDVAESIVSATAVVFTASFGLLVGT